MIIGRDVASLSHEEYRVYFYRERAAFAKRMAEYDRYEAEMAHQRPGAIASDPVADLAALGVPNARGAWWLGVVATRVWLLEIASEGLYEPGSPAGEYQMFRYVMLNAAIVLAERRRRRFGGSEMTAGDVEESRLSLGIESEQWNQYRSRAAWVLRGLKEAR